MINTFKRALNSLRHACRSRRYRHRCTGPSPEPGAARRHQGAMPLRLHGALLQHPAGWRGFAAVPAEEHVEPVIELSDCGACGRGAGGGHGQAGRYRSAKSRSTGGRSDSRAEDRCGSPCGSAKQRADFRHPQRLPLRLPKSLRGRTDRRRTGVAMPGKKQGQTFCRMREGRLRRRRWCGNSGCTSGRRGPARCRNGSRRGADRDRAAADAAARRVVRVALGLRRRRPHNLRRRPTGRRPDHSMPCDQRRAAFAGLQGRAESVRGAVIARVIRRRERRG